MRTGAERRNVVCGIARPARQHFRRIVLKDENGGFSRDTGYSAVDELIGNHVTNHRDAPSRKGIEQAQQTRLALCLARQRMYRSRYVHGRKSQAPLFRKIRLAASIRFAATGTA